MLGLDHPVPPTVGEDFFPDTWDLWQAFPWLRTTAGASPQQCSVYLIVPDSFLSS